MVTKLRDRLVFTGVKIWSKKRSVKNPNRKKHTQMFESKTIKSAHLTGSDNISISSFDSSSVYVLSRRFSACELNTRFVRATVALRAEASFVVDGARCRRCVSLLQKRVCASRMNRTSDGRYCHIIMENPEPLSQLFYVMCMKVTKI
jgi:hypothetical protein